VKVIYTIFTTSHGNGGHFYSLVTTAKALSAKFEVIIVNFGFNKSPVIENAELKHYNILMNNSNIFDSYATFRKIVKRENPSVLHSFCTLSYTFVRIYALLHPIKTILTKCGGPNPKGYFPFTRELILYSQENYDYFLRKRKFRSANLYLIPNRVLEPKTDLNRIDTLKRLLKISDNHKVFLRIGRISMHYKTSIFQSIELINDINNKGYHAILLLIGSVQDKEVADEIEKASNNYVFLINDSRFTGNASEIIDIADFVIGTGRSLMEAASKSKILLTPNNKSSYPVLVTEHNFGDLIKTNFSPRNSIPQNDQDTLNTIINLFTDSDESNNLEKNSLTYFKEEFDVSAKTDKYNELYNKIDVRRTRLNMDLLVQVAFLKNYVKRFQG
jgi:hypothetical protein